MKSKLLTICLAVMVIFMFATIPVGASQKELKVGCNMALSGPVSVVGIAWRNGAQIVADYYNQKGGLKVGNDTYKIVIIDGDNKFTPEGATTASRRLVERDGVKLMMGGIATPDTMGVQAVTEPAKIPILHTAAADEVLKDKKYSFRAFVCYREMMPGLFKWLVSNKPDVKKIALFDMDYESGYFGHKLAIKMAEKKGLEVVYDGYFEPGSMDFNSYLLRILAKKPDVIFNTASPYPTWPIIIKQARALGYEGLFMENSPPAVADNIKIAGKENLQGLIGFGYGTEGPSIPQGIKDFKKEYMSLYGEWSNYPLVYVPALYAFFAAVEKANSLDADKIVTVLEDGSDWTIPLGFAGRFAGAETYGFPHQWYAPQWVLEVQGDKAVAVDKIPISDMVAGWD